MAWRNPYPRQMLDQDSVEVYARIKGELWSEYMPTGALCVRAGARHACARLRRERNSALERADRAEFSEHESARHAVAMTRERDSARRNLDALEWLALRGYPCGRGADGRVSARYDPDTLEPEWHATWAECAAAVGWEG
jgi:hypothetical protein